MNSDSNNLIDNMIVGKSYIHREILLEKYNFFKMSNENENLKPILLSNEIFEHVLYYFLLNKEDFNESNVVIKKQFCNIKEKHTVTKLKLNGFNQAYKGTYYIDARDSKDDNIVIYKDKTRYKHKYRLDDIKQWRHVPFYKKNNKHKKKSFDNIINTNFECVYVGSLSRLFM